MQREPERHAHEEAGRPFCYRCHKPRLTCICASVPRVRNKTPVWILQHPRERFHPIGTARIAQLGLERVVVDVRHHDRRTPPAEFPEGAVLLYPNKDATPLCEVGQVAGEAPSALVVLDGTWAHARTIFRDNPWLHELPRYGLSPREPSRYRIRREPAPECVSTIESVVYALELIEPETEGLDGLLSAFHGMIDDQIRIYQQRRAGKRRETKERRPLLGAKVGNIVLVEAEALSFQEGRQRRRELVHWCGVRPATGETFERVCRPTVDLEPLHLFHMGLPAQVLRGGMSAEQLADDWRAFARVDDIIVAWTASTLTIRPPDNGSATRVLKGAYCNVRRGSRGTLEQMFAREGLPLEDLGLKGRAGRRLAATLGMYELLVSLLT